MDTIFEQKRIIKNLNYDSDTGRFILTDNQNNSYICDMFGRKKSLFKSRISGISNRYKRKGMLQPLLIKNTNENNKTISPLKYSPMTNTENSQNYNTISTKKSIDYHPIRRKFDDAYGLPKSLVMPFFNLKNGELKEKNKRELIEHLNKYFSNEVSKNNISLNNQSNKPALNYLNYDLSDYSSFAEDNKKILKLIDNTIQEYRHQYKNKLDILYKNPVVKALKNFKNFLILNQDIKVINGYKIKEPSEGIKDKLKTIDKNIRNYYPNIFEKTKKINRLVELYEIDKYNSINKNKNYDFEENYLYNNIIVGPDKLNNICKSKDFTIGRVLEMDFGLSEEDKKNKINRIKRLGNSAFRPKNPNIQNRRIKLFSGLKSNKQKQSEEEQLARNSSRVAITYKDTLETLSNNNQNMSDINIDNSNKNKSLEQKIADNELSFISELSEREKKIKKKKKYRIKSVKTQRLQTDIENKLLDGFQKEEEIEEKKPSTIKKEPKFKSFLDCYKNDTDLLKITNPKAYELQKKQEEHELMIMKKKIELIALFEKNQRKNKKTNKKNK